MFHSFKKLFPTVDWHDTSTLCIILQKECVRYMEGPMEDTILRLPMCIDVAIAPMHTHSASLNNIKRPRLYGFRGLNIMGDRNYINYPRDSSNGMESRFKP